MNSGIGVETWMNDIPELYVTYWKSALGLENINYKDPQAGNMLPYFKTFPVALWIELNEGGCNVGAPGMSQTVRDFPDDGQGI